MEIKIKKLREDAILPSKKTDGAIGYDLSVPADICIEHPRQVVPLGFAIELPEYIEAKIEARSGFSSKGIEGFALLKEVANNKSYNAISEEQLWRRIDKSERFNADVLTGKIDPDYRGEVGVIIRNNQPEKSFLIQKGTRIAQMTFYPTFPVDDFEIVDELSETERGDGGFGHTGI